MKRTPPVARLRTPDVFTIGPWQASPCPADSDHAVGCWRMAEAAAAQHPLNVRALYRMNAEGGAELVAVGGVCEWMKGDGVAFVWAPEDLPKLAWRIALPALRSGLYGCHERGMRRISAIVAARWAGALRLVKRLGFDFMGIETGFPNTVRPMLRYSRAWPAFETEPHLVRHQRHELELACFASWCPELAT